MVHLKQFETSQKSGKLAADVSRHLQGVRGTCPGGRGPGQGCFHQKEPHLNGDEHTKRPVPDLLSRDSLPAACSWEAVLCHTAVTPGAFEHSPRVGLWVPQTPSLQLGVATQHPQTPTFMLRSLGLNSRPSRCCHRCLCRGPHLPPFLASALTPGQMGFHEFSPAPGHLLPLGVVVPLALASAQGVGEQWTPRLVTGHVPDLSCCQLCPREQTTQGGAPIDGNRQCGQQMHLVISTVEVLGLSLLRHPNHPDTISSSKAPNPCRDSSQPSRVHPTA